MIRRNAGTVVVAAAVVILVRVAFSLALAQDKLPEPALDLSVYLFAITLTVFVVERMIAWREERRWLAAKNWLHMILLKTIDDLLEQLLPATVPQEGEGIAREVAVYEVTGGRVHFGAVKTYGLLRLLVSPDDKDLQSHVLWYAQELEPARYVGLAQSALSKAREQIRDTFGSSARVLEADITAMLMSFEQAVAAAIRHLDSATRMRDEKLEDASYRDGKGQVLNVL